jgi:AraC-like DNA-binding protein
MIQIAGEYGLASADCIAGTGLTPEDLADPSREIGGEQELGVLRNILRALPATIPFAFRVGERCHLTMHGMLGFALMCCADGWEAIDLSVRYFDLSFSFNRLAFEVSGRQGRLIYEDEDSPDDLRAAIVARDIGALAAFERDSLGRVVPALALEFRAPPPAYLDPFEAVFGVAPRYNAPRNCVAFDVAVLETRPALADEHGRRVSEEQCRALIEQRGARSGLAGRVRSRIVRTLGEFPSMQTVAAELGMTTRTLRNRLARESTSYRELVDQARQMFAEQFLATGMTLDAIAERLGYTETSTFVAAFKRWKGVPPRRYREEAQQRHAR